MKMNRRHIAIALTAVMILFSSCGKNEGEVIPRKKLAKIYAEMLVTDQWINSTPGIRQIADTSLVYEPILEKYGYDSKDYRKSIDKYMDDPERFSRILRESAAILTGRLEELKLEQARLLVLAKLPKIEYDFELSELAPCLEDEPYVHTYDSLAVEHDSTSLLFSFVSIERSDTLYEGLRMVFRDSLAVTDSLAKVDSLSKADSIKAADSLKRMTLKKKLFGQQDSVRMKSKVGVRQGKTMPIKK